MTKVPAPPPTPDVPDEATAKSPDYTGAYADHRVFHCKIGGLSYGTDDKGHAAALILSALSLAAILLVAVLGVVGLFSGRDAPWLGTVMAGLLNAFIFTAGIAVGKGSKARRGPTDD